MAQVFIQAFQIFCGIPGGSLGGALVAPIVNPMALISCFIPIMLSVMFIGDPNMLNSIDNKQKEWARGSQSAFMIYYTIFFFVALSILYTACKAADFIP